MRFSHVRLFVDFLSSFDFGGWMIHMFLLGMKIFILHGILVLLNFYFFIFIFFVSLGQIFCLILGTGWIFLDSSSVYSCIAFDECMGAALLGQSLLYLKLKEKKSIMLVFVCSDWVSYPILKWSRITHEVLSIH